MPKWNIDRVAPVARKSVQANTSTTVVRIAVARFESMCATPIFARIAVSPAKKAENKAQTNQFTRKKVSASRLRVAWKPPRSSLENRRLTQPPQQPAVGHLDPWSHKRSDGKEKGHGYVRRALLELTIQRINRCLQRSRDQPSCRYLP